MKLFKYGNFIKESKEDINSICKNYGIENYTINEDGSVDVDGNVNLSYSKLTEIPLKFGKVSGSFYCNKNKLTSLEGSPREVGGHFCCSNNELTSLEGSPNKVGSFFCSNNELTSLSGISKYISKGIYCEDNKLRDVKGIRDGWRGKFDVEGNPVYEIFELFPFNVWDEVIELLNEYDVIKEEGVNIQALEQVFIDMDMEFSFFKNYKTIL
jgi:hypothetical protein